MEADKKEFQYASNSLKKEAKDENEAMDIEAARPVRLLDSFLVFALRLLP